MHTDQVHGTAAVVLAVDDSDEVLTLVERALHPEFAVHRAQTMAEARSSIDAEPPDLVVLDISLPDGDGLELCKELRSQSDTADLPIIFLTGRSETGQKVAAFSLDADDYIVKPFDRLELQARVRRRLSKRSEPSARATIRIGGLEIDTVRMLVHVRHGSEVRTVELTALEFRLLHHLATCEGAIRSREQLVAEVWNGVAVSERTVDSHVSNLRRKLGPLGHLIQSMRGVGYSLCRPPRAAPERSW